MKCEHGLTVAVCLQCFHMGKTEKRAVPKVRRGVDPASIQTTPVVMKVQPQSQAAPAPMQPYTYARDAGMYDDSKLWMPPVRPSLIDNLPKRDG